MLIIIGLAASGYVGQIDPRTTGILVTVGYALPAFIIANFLMIVFWVFFHWKYVILPVAGFILCYQPVSLYVPFHASSEVPEGCLKVMTYNTWSFGLAEENNDTTPSRERCAQVMNNILSEDCDFVCLQESGRWPLINNVIDSLIRPHYPYVVNAEDQRAISTLLFSKYPVEKVEVIDYETEGNFSVAYKVNVNGRGLLLVNCHLETVHFSYEDKRNFKSLVDRQYDRRESKSKTMHFARRLANSSKIRAAQADAVAAFIKQHRGESIILCGDFNDLVNSYTHRIIAHDLTDCYRETATGPGFSYQRYGMKVRIDNALVSSNLKPHNFEVKSCYHGSDHFPLVGYVEFSGNSR